MFPLSRRWAGKGERKSGRRLGAVPVIAPGPKRTLLAVRPPGYAHRPPVEHHPVAEIVALLRWNALAQLHFYLQGVLAAVGNA